MIPIAKSKPEQNFFIQEALDRYNKLSDSALASARRSPDGLESGLALLDR